MKLTDDMLRNAITAAGASAALSVKDARAIIRRAIAVGNQAGIKTTAAHVRAIIADAAETASAA